MKSATTQTVAEAIAAELSAAGVDRVFGLPGGEVRLARLQAESYVF